MPGFLPTDKNIYRGIFALAMLGSPPCAMTLKDSVEMNLPPPIDRDSDRIRVSKQRLICVLDRLGVLDKDGCGEQIQAIIEELWLQARPYADVKRLDMESSGEARDWLELGILKWMCTAFPPTNHPGSDRFACRVVPVQASTRIIQPVRCAKRRAIWYLTTF